MTVFHVFYLNVFAVKNLVFGFNIAANSLYLAAKLLFFSGENEYVHSWN